MKGSGVEYLLLPRMARRLVRLVTLRYPSTSFKAAYSYILVCRGTALGGLSEDKSRRCRSLGSRPRRVKSRMTFIESLRPPVLTYP